MSFSIPYPEGAISLHTDRVSKEDAERQERTAREILRRLEHQSGLILADEVGMGKTFVALAVASAVALARPEDGPVVVMVPPSLKQKWPKDWAVFFEKCLDPQVCQHLDTKVADSGVAFMKLLDDPPERRKEIIFLTHGALGRSLTDEWIKLAVIRRALLRRMTKEHVRKALPRFVGRLLRHQVVDRKDPDLWNKLLGNPPDRWRGMIARAGIDIYDDPVPRPLIHALGRLNFRRVLEALDRLPLRESPNTQERLQDARQALSESLKDLWKVWLRDTRFHSPLLIFDEAHHLKNVTQLSSLFIEKGAAEDSDAVSRGPLAGVFSRMLFLTATPFQLGHRELISVVSRFEGINWSTDDAPPGGKDKFQQELKALENSLNDAQRFSFQLEKAWGRLAPAQLRREDGKLVTPDEWWRAVVAKTLTDGPASVVHKRFGQCHEGMRRAESLLKPWVIRHLKPRFLPRRPDTEPPKRREVLVGARIRENPRITGDSGLEDARITGDSGLEVEGKALLPFLLAVRAQVALASRPTSGNQKRAVFAEGLASSYEAYLETRRGKGVIDEDDGAQIDQVSDDWQINWYLRHLDKVLPEENENVRAQHPKVAATIDRAVRLWWEKEKSLIFCHYRATGRALRKWVSARLETEMLKRAGDDLRIQNLDDIREELERRGHQFFDTDGKLRNQAQTLLREVVSQYKELSSQHEEPVVEIGLRFLRTPSFLVRYYPLGSDDPVSAFKDAFDRPDDSGLTLRNRIEEFCRFLAERCVLDERIEYLEALGRIQTGTYHRESKDPDDITDDVRYLPNVRLANGEVPNDARRRLMLAFNTPFFPEILIASSVLAEGVDLHLDCRFVIHHDLCWNPSTLEQRTGRVDRIGCKAEKAYNSIHVYLPFVTATQDEKMFRVVRDRERWFSVIMGEKFSLDESSTEKIAERIPFPEDAARTLAFDLSLPGWT